MIKTEFHANDFLEGDRVVLVNDSAAFINVNAASLL